MPNATSSVLTLPQAHLLSELLSRLGDPVQYAPNPDIDSIIDGVARTITDFNGETSTGATDVREMFLHVSGIMEYWFPVADVLTAMKTGLFCFDHKA